MNKYLHEIHDSSQAAAEIGVKILSILDDIQKELLQLSENIKSFSSSVVGVPDSAETQKVMDSKAKQATTEVDIEASHTIRK